MNQDNKLTIKKIKFAELHDKIMRECVEKRVLEEINELTDIYSEFEKLYDDLKNNYGIDYSNKFFEVGNFIENHASKLQERNKVIKVTSEENVQETTIQTKENKDNLETLFFKLVNLITEEQKFENINSTINIICDIDDLVRKIAMKLNEQVQTEEITLEEQNNYFKKLNDLGFKGIDSSVLDINDEFKIIRRLVNEKEDTKDLGETNAILEQYLNKVDEIREMINEAKDKGIICEKQEILYDIVLETYKNQMLPGRRM